MIVAASDYVIWGVVLIGCAFALAALEIFVPSMGLIAAVSSLLAIAGVIALFQEGPAWGLTGLGAVLMGVVVGIIFVIRILPHTPMGRGLILGSDLDDEDRAPGEDSLHARRELEAALLEAEGVATSALHPVGFAEIDGARVEVIARSGVIDKGARLKVVEVRGNEIYVRPIG